MPHRRKKSLSTRLHASVHIRPAEVVAVDTRERSKEGKMKHPVDPIAYKKYAQKVFICRLFFAIMSVSLFIMRAIFRAMFGTKYHPFYFFDWCLLIVAMFFLLLAIVRNIIDRRLMYQSMVYTSPDGVLYCKRVWRPFSRIHSIHYRIESIDYYWPDHNKTPTTIKGKIKAELNRNDNTVHRIHNHTKLILPPVFTDADIIFHVLDSIRTTK